MNNSLNLRPNKLEKIKDQFYCGLLTKDEAEDQIKYYFGYMKIGKLNNYGDRSSG